MDPRTKRTIVFLVLVALAGAGLLWMAGRALEDAQQRIDERRRADERHAAAQARKRLEEESSKRSAEAPGDDATGGDAAPETPPGTPPR